MKGRRQDIDEKKDLEEYSAYFYSTLIGET